MSDHHTTNYIPENQHNDDLFDNNTILTDTHLNDVGLNPPNFYNSKLSKPIAYLRNLLLPLIHFELPLLQKIQSYQNHNLINLYFLWTANLGSHTFYVIMLPLPVWLGSINLSRDLVIVLGLGVYFTGVIKDLLCLPRPSSPPLKRLTMSHYTSKEYGCPSSHSANATSVSMILFLHTFNNNSFSPIIKYLIYSFFTWYWFTLIFGRIYCGMHGLVDISLGILVGIFTVSFRLALKPIWDFILLSPKSNLSFLTPPILSSIYYSIIYFHPIPIEQCPCFEDSVAFIAVLLGFDLSYWSLKPSNLNSKYSSLDLNQLYLLSPAKINYDYSKLGITFTILRILIGILSVITWKTISKPLFTSIINKLRYGSSLSPKSSTNPCFAYIPRSDTKIIVKYIVYSGIPTIAIYSMYIFKFLNI
ncbi:hypothetical protein C6P40_001303 [Pichia californica]|uniref:Phosphatidic acid phosphatase type 2/haloperoxidase domain-containing protein n=1 Tax=Pichia californica TaxID=460514 RepID=A0A9P7BFJ8_9ASCO|nr:hypothetical protein C6P42_005424 [[Candida] californica]KAG0688190.1 hypothetical protein C6P40_001303 [[Candida] californica]